MPVSVVVGGQYGSEGKGKIALHIAQTTDTAAVVRVGGPNSGHTGIDDQGRAWIFRQLPASCLAGNALVILPAGSLIDSEILQREIERVQLDERRLFIDGRATVVTPAHRRSESDEGIIESIGSTGSGTGAALRERLSRRADHKLASDDAYLRKFIHPFIPDLLRPLLNKGRRIVIEGTQGFGLSIWHGSAFPNATSRDTTAANFVAETGLAPHDVDDVVLAIRSFPIRVGGNSGPLQNEIDWPTLAHEARLRPDHVELTSATKRIRRVARFHADVVRQAIAVNRPHRIVMNHLDYVDPDVKSGVLSTKALRFLIDVERMIERKIDLAGVSPHSLIEVETFVPSRNVLDAGDLEKFQDEVRAFADSKQLPSPEARYAALADFDPYPEIPSALLNSGHLASYAITTGMIDPFDINALKKPATYLVPIEGQVIYLDENGERCSFFLSERDVEGEKDVRKDFELRPNSICYLTLRPEFRIPAYLAGRFNLLIRDVYRGLLVGTGPLVDPGFQGVLSIPVHNFTSNKYILKAGEGFVYFEFSKLSWSNPEDMEKPPWVQNPINTQPPFPKSKKNRRTLNDYILEATGGGPAQNAIQRDIKRVKKLAKKASFRIGLISVGTVVGAVLFLFTAITGFVSVLQFTRAAQKDLADSHEKLGLEVRALRLELDDLKRLPR